MCRYMCVRTIYMRLYFFLSSFQLHVPESLTACRFGIPLRSSSHFHHIYFFVSHLPARGRERWYCDTGMRQRAICWCLYSAESREPHSFYMSYVMHIKQSQRREIRYALADYVKPSLSLSLFLSLSLSSVPRTDLCDANPNIRCKSWWSDIIRARAAEDEFMLNHLNNVVR